MANIKFLVSGGARFKYFVVNMGFCKNTHNSERNAKRSDQENRLFQEEKNNS